MTMNSEIKEKWLNALRSEEYQQTQGNLKTDDGYCCLGVLCDIYSQEMNVPWERDYSRSYYYMQGEGEVLPYRVQQWAGLENICPEVIDEYYVNQSLVTLNDNGMDFLTISNLIEKYL